MQDNFVKIATEAHQASRQGNYEFASTLFYDLSVLAQNTLEDELLKNKYLYLHYIERLKVEKKGGALPIIDNILSTLSVISGLEDDRLTRRIEPIIDFFFVLRHCIKGNINEVIGLLEDIRKKTEVKPINQIETVTHLLSESVVVRENLKICIKNIKDPEKDILKEIASLERCVEEKRQNSFLGTGIQKIFDAYHECLVSMRTSNINLIIKKCVDGYIEKITDNSLFAIIAEDLRSAIGMSTIGHIERKNKMKKKELMSQRTSHIIAISSGIVFVVFLLLIALFVPNPTSFQFFIFRTVMALAAAGFGVAIPGFLRIELPIWQKGFIHAGGALAMFALVYLINPASFVLNR